MFSPIISGLPCHIQLPGTDFPIQQRVLERVWVPLPPSHTRQQESAAGGYPEKLLGAGGGGRGCGGGPRAESLEAHLFLGLSFSISMAQLERRENGWKVMEPSSCPIYSHSPLAIHGANTVAREANPGQAESSGAPSMLCGTLSRSRDGEAEGR